MPHQDIKIGTLIAAQEAVAAIPALIGHGFETFSITFWETALWCDLPKLAADVTALLEGTDATISSVSVYGNALADDQRGLAARESWHRVVEAAPLFGTDLVTGYAGRVIDRPVEESIAKYAEVFGEIARKAKANHLRIAFENCSMGGNWHTGDWNFAFKPAAWEMLFNALPYDNIGLEWEPCHQLTQLIDPIPQLRKWVGKILHVHGKDATIAWDVIREQGILGPEWYSWNRTPGFGDSNWTDIISILRIGGFKGSIDIEGFHDPVYRDELEYTGQVRALNYLKECRGGDFIPNPV